MNASNQRLQAPCDGLDLHVQDESMDPGSLTSHQLQSELASILAKGVDRLRKGPHFAVSDDPPESSKNCLERVATIRPYGSRRQPETTPEE